MTNALPTEEDYRRYDRIWRKVSPELDPYPEVRAEQNTQPRAGDSKLLTLPGAESDPCCMGSAAQAELEVIEGFLRDELADAQTYRCLAVHAPTAEGRRVMRQIASDEAGHVRTLRSAHFLITGETYSVTVVLPPQPKLPWCDRLLRRLQLRSRCGGDDGSLPEKAVCGAVGGRVPSRGAAPQAAGKSIVNKMALAVYEPQGPLFWRHSMLTT